MSLLELHNRGSKQLVEQSRGSGTLADGSRDQLDGLLSAEKPRPELLSCYHYVQADIRAPACCLHNVSSQCCGFNPQCSAPTYADNRTLPASTFPDQTPSSGQPQILPSKPGAQSRTMLSCKWLHLFLIATRICPGACNPIIAVPLLLVDSLRPLPHLLDDHDLMHLTSWSRRAGPTYICGDYRSMIDHVFARHAHAAPIARLAGRDTFRLAAWRQGGYHVALSVSSLGLDLSLSTGHPHRSVDSCKASADCQSIEELNSALLEAVQHHLPATAKSSRLAPLANTVHACRYQGYVAALPKLETGGHPYWSGHLDGLGSLCKVPEGA